MNIRLLIALLFVITVVSAIIGVAIYYSSLTPVRLVSQCNNVSDVLDKITYLEYNITDMRDNLYVVKINNNPSTRSGTAELYLAGNLTMKVTYKYSTRLESIRIDYANGTNITLQGLNATLYEEPFYTSLIYDYNQTSGTASAQPFPGLAPVYLLCYVGKANDVNWDYYAGLVKPRNQPYGLVDVILNFGKTKYKGDDINVVLIQITRRGAIQNKWTLPVYTAALANINGVPVAITLTIEIPTPQGGDRYTFHLIDLQTTG